jgi:hypothetical protein
MGLTCLQQQYRALAVAHDRKGGDVQVLLAYPRPLALHMASVARFFQMSLL